MDGRNRGVRNAPPGGGIDTRHTAVVIEDTYDTIPPPPQTYSHHRSHIHTIFFHLTMDVWCEDEMGVATDVSIPPSVGPARSLAPLTSFTLFVHTAPLCANIANPFQIGCAIVQNFFAGLRPTPRQGSRPGPQKGNY